MSHHSRHGRYFPLVLKFCSACASAFGQNFWAKGFFLNAGTCLHRVSSSQNLPQDADACKGMPSCSLGILGSSQASLGCSARPRTPSLSSSSGQQDSIINNMQTLWPDNIIQSSEDSAGVLESDTYQKPKGQRHRKTIRRSFMFLSLESMKASTSKRYALLAAGSTHMLTIPKKHKGVVPSNHTDMHLGFRQVRIHVEVCLGSDRLEARCRQSGDKLAARLSRRNVHRLHRQH